MLLWHASSLAGLWWWLWWRNHLNYGKRMSLAMWHFSEFGTQTHKGPSNIRKANKKALFLRLVVREGKKWTPSPQTLADVLQPWAYSLVSHSERVHITSAACLRKWHYLWNSPDEVEQRQGLRGGYNKLEQVNPHASILHTSAAAQSLHCVRNRSSIRSLGGIPLCHTAKLSKIAYCMSHSINS